MSKHTPGPWVTTGRTGQGHDTSWGIKHRSPGVDGGEFCRVNVLHKTAEAIETGEANARLIAAAPLMYDLLVRYDEATEADFVEGRLAEETQNLIMKIKGEET